MNMQYQLSTYSHEILWRASMTTLKTAESALETVRPDHLSILSLLSGFLAFEGFINLVGHEVAPKVWENEHGFFSKHPYKGIVGKIDYLYSLFCGATLDKGCRMYQTFKAIKAFRDTMAHAKVLQYSDKTTGADAPSIKTRWDDYENPAKVRPALMELKAFAETIRVEALKILKEEYKLSPLHYKAFEGPISTGDGEG